MGFLPDRLADRIGILKIAVIVLGIITLGFIGHSYYSNDGRDKAFLSCVIICFIISFVWVLIIFFDVVQQSDFHKKADLLYNFVAFFFYIITLLCFVVSLIDWTTGKHNTTRYRLAERVFAFIFGVVTTSAYGYLSYLLYHSIGS